MKWFLHFALVIIGPFICAVADAAPPAVSSYKLPLLAVSADNTGLLERVEFTLTRKPGVRAPLTIAIAEDTPGGTGESLRASVWLAATVAAMERLDDLSGVQIYIDLPGRVDGPSAGGVITLAILSALDGRPFPGDCVMTGCIMPDGTIGAVGGIAAKMRGAAAGGAKRMLVPAYLRFEADPKTGEQVDLKRLAASLHVEFLPVQNITEAYRVAHRLPNPGQIRLDDSVLDLPDATEDLLKQTYGDEEQAGAKLWDAIPKDRQQQISQDPVGKRLMIGLRDKADNAFRSGKLLYAADTITLWRQCLEAREKDDAAFAALAGSGPKEDLKQLDGDLDGLIRALPDPMSMVDSSRQKLPEAGIQLCSDYFENVGTSGLVGQLQGPLDDDLAELEKPENQGDDRQKNIWTNIVELRDLQILLANIGVGCASRSVDDNARLAATLPKSTITGDVATVERLFYSSYLAASNSFEKDVVGEAATELNVSGDQAVAAMCQRDDRVAIFFSVAQALPSLHRNFVLRTGRPEGRITGAAGAYIYANSLAQVSGLITRWGPQLDPYTDDQGEMHYGRTDVLNYLLSAARDHALVNIAECRRREIPCIQPIALFQNAEMARDDKDEDKVDVLREYWSASLQAKALLMLFSGMK
jgi:Lon protease (S16) C-terminal proteolytic domain